MNEVKLHLKYPRTLTHEAYAHIKHSSEPPQCLEPYKNSDDNHIIERGQCDMHPPSQ
jgi:hypothetical protein